MTNLALAGFGKWGQRLFGSLQSVQGSGRFTAIVSRSPDRVHSAGGAAGLKVHATLDDALFDPSIDAVVLATPHSLHAEQVAAAARAGKHVFVEKPFALTKASAAAALWAVATAGTVVAVGHNRRFLPAMARLKTLIDKSELGQIVHIETTYTSNAATTYVPDHWRAAPGESPAGGLAGSGIHMIDALIHLGGPIAEVYAIAARRNPEALIDDTTAALFTLQSGITASLTNLVATVPSFRIKVFGSTGTAEMRGERQLVVCPLGGNESVEELPQSDTLAAELVAFVDAIEGKSPFPISPSEILNGAATFEAVCQSAASHERTFI